MVNDSLAETRRPGSFGRAFWWRLTDNLFRRLGWFLVPVLLMGALGVVQALNTTALYRTSAKLSVSTNPLLPDNPLSGANVQMFESLSSATSKIIADQLGTERFMLAVAEAAGFGDAIEQGLVDLDVIRTSVWVSTSGDSLVTVNSTWADAQTSYQLVVATIDQYQRYLTDTVASDAAEAEAFWSDRLVGLSAERDEAESDLNRFVAQLPDQGTGDEYPVTDTIEIGRLGSRLESIEDEIRAVEDEIDTAVLSRAQQTTAAGRSFTVVDEPRVPGAPDSTLIKQGMLVVSFLLMGVVIATAAVLVTTVLDHTVCSPIDLSSIAGAMQVATVPIVGQRRGSSRHRRRGRPARPIAEAR